MYHLLALFEKRPVPQLSNYSSYYFHKLLYVQRFDNQIEAMRAGIKKLKSINSNGDCYTYGVVDVPEEGTPEDLWLDNDLHVIEKIRKQFPEMLAKSIQQVLV